MSSRCEETRDRPQVRVSDRRRTCPASYKLSTANIPSFATDDNKLDEWLQDEQIAELQIGSRLARHRQRWEAHCAVVGEAEGRGLCAAE